MSSRGPEESPSESSAPVPALDLASAGASPGCLKAAGRSASRKHQPSGHSTLGAHSLARMAAAVQHTHTWEQHTYKTGACERKVSRCLQCSMHFLMSCTLQTAMAQADRSCQVTCPQSMWLHPAHSSGESTHRQGQPQWTGASCCAPHSTSPARQWPLTALSRRCSRWGGSATQMLMRQWGSPGRPLHALATWPTQS